MYKIWHYMGPQFEQNVNEHNLITPPFIGCDNKGYISELVTTLFRRQ